MPLTRPERTLGYGRISAACLCGSPDAIAFDLMSDGGMTAEDVRSVTFEMPPSGRPGHDEKSGDDFLALALLDKIAAAMAKTR